MKTPMAAGFLSSEAPHHHQFIGRAQSITCTNRESKIEVAPPAEGGARWAYFGSRASIESVHPPARSQQQ